METANELPTDMFIMTQGFTNEEVMRLQADLVALGIPARTSQALTLSADRVQEVLDILTWGNFLYASFGIVATAYAKQWAKNVADAHFKNRKEIREAAVKTLGDGISSIRQFVRALAKMQKPAHPPVQISVANGIIKFRVYLKDENEAIETVARSVFMLPHFQRAAENIAERMMGGSDFGFVKAVMEEDGFRLEWFNCDTWQAFARQFDMHGNPKGDKYEIDKKNAV